MSTKTTAADSAAKKPITVSRVKRRLAKIDAMTDPAKAKAAKRRLDNAVLTGIAEGKFRNPVRAANLVVKTGES